MIETVSYPEDLSSWDPDAQPFYLELFGETSPKMDLSYAEVLPSGSGADGQPQTAAPTPIYEYWWTIGHPGYPPAPLRSVDRSVR
jgi:hypothetical protein